MWIWYLLIEADKIKVDHLLDFARSRVRNNDDSLSRCSALIFIGKHGNYKDRDQIAS